MRTALQCCWYSRQTVIAHAYSLLLLLHSFATGFVVKDVPKVSSYSGAKDMQEADLAEEESGSVRLNLPLYLKALSFGQSDEERKKVREILQKLNRKFASNQTLPSDAGPQTSGLGAFDRVQSDSPYLADSREVMAVHTLSESVHQDTIVVPAASASSAAQPVASITSLKSVRRKPQKTQDYLKKKSVKAKSGRFIDDDSLLLHSPEEHGQHFQGDIVLTAEQAQALLEEAEPQTKRRRQKRKFINSPFRRWDPRLPIEFSFDGSHSPKEQKIIELAMEHWQNITCLNFVRKDDEPRGNRIVFTDVDGCASNVGRHPLGEPQFVSIAPECMRLGVIAHEVAHALGFWHEQSRPDRDKYVTVVWNNIELGSSGQFTKETSDDVDDEGIDYDYGSIMHYRSKAFARTDDLFTIETNVGDYQKTIGQRDQLSFNDIKLMNKVYCTSACPQQLPCQRGGYTDPRKCDICRCPDGFTGRLCDEIMPGFGLPCGGTVELSESVLEISSPNYPSLFKEGQECSWLFVAPPGFHVQLQFVGTFDLYCKAKHSLCMDYVEVRNSSDFANTGMRYCCYNTPTSTIYSSTNELLVLFRSFYRSGRGFQARLSAVGTDFPPS